MTTALFTALVGATLLGGCVMDADDSQTSDGDSEAALSSTSDHGHQPTPLPPIGADQEYGFFNNQTVTFRFPGFFTPQAETFFIWNLGTSIQHGAPYPANSHERVYGVFAPGPAGSTHHVDGQDGFDHYHIVTKNSGTHTFDVFLVFPGPNFNAATFQAPLSEHDMNTAIAAGILGAPLTTVQAGFDPLVFKVPVTKVNDHGHGDDGDCDHHR
jgi:hypothetical protein